MTLLKIEVKTVTGKYHPEDMIKIWAPSLRPNGDMVVSTAPEIVKLVQGYAEVELIPGPARVQIMCGGTLDNAVRKVTIPDAATATLRAVLEDGFDWEPEIVTEVRRYRNDAVAASTSATEEAADAANSATNAATSATNAATSATNAATSAGSAAASEAAVAASATEASTAATNAATSAGEAATHEDTSLDAAAAAIAAAVSVAQFQGQGFPNGVVTAPVGSIYTDTSATAGAIRWIKARGAGNTGWEVEWGDTGWRDITSALLNGWTANGIYVRRVGRVAQFRGYILDGRSATGDICFRLPEGFGFSGVGWFLPLPEGKTLQINGYRDVSLLSGSLYFNGGYHLASSIIVKDSWPATLPGTPAQL